MSEDPSRPFYVAAMRTVRPGHEAEFEDAIEDFFVEAGKEPETLGAHLIRPLDGSGSRDYGILRTFRSREDQKNFYASDLYRAWNARVAPMVEGEVKKRDLHGLEAFFRDTGEDGAPPPAWKMAFLTWIAVNPAVYIFAHGPTGGVGRASSPGGTHGRQRLRRGLADLAVHAPPDPAAAEMAPVREPLAMSAVKTQTPLVIMLMILTFTTGIVDAVSFVGLGRVFTALMTGNVAFLGFALGGLDSMSAAGSAAALGAFAAGAVAAGRLASSMKQATHRRWLTIAAVLEVIFLLFAVVSSLGYDYRSHPPSASVYGIIVGLSVAMGLRSVTVLRLADPDLKTTVLTLTIASIAADSSLAGGTNPRITRRILSVLLLMAGAGVGVFLLQHYGTTVPLALTVVLVAGSTAFYVLHPASRLAGWGKK